MKRESKLTVQSEEAPGGRSKAGEPTIAKTPFVSRGKKKFGMKKRMEMRPLSQREKRERAAEERKQAALLEEFGVSEQDLRRWRRHALAARRLDRNGPVRLKRYGREAAFEEVGDVEHCRDLAGKFARESAGEQATLLAMFVIATNRLWRNFLLRVMCKGTDDATR